MTSISISSQKPLEPGIFFFEALESPGFTHRKSTVLPAPTVEGLLRNTVLPTKLANGAGLALRLLQNANDLLLTESRTLH